MVNALRVILGGRARQSSSEESASVSIPKGVELEERFPSGYNVYSIISGPRGGGEVLIGAGDPATSSGAVFIGDGSGAWDQIDLPDETALLSNFVRFNDGHYVAGGMSAIGRGALLTGSRNGKEWKSIETDLHPYASIAALLKLPNGELIASTGQMITQGKTKPVLFRSTDEGKTWTKEEIKLPITMFLSFETAPDGTIFIGTSGDHVTAMYKSTDGARTFQEMPAFPMFKTYKMLNVRLVNVKGTPRLFVVLWGYKTDIADRVVRIYMSNPDFTAWEELPPVDDSHFLFSFLVTREKVFFAGSEKGKIYRSENFGRSWELVTQFTTNIGAYALHEDGEGRIWVGKDFVPPSECSLWRLK
jgi:hypothetical protein